MVETLHDWQSLVSGLLAFLAGTFVLIQGYVDKKRFKHAQQLEMEKEISQTAMILKRLDKAAISFYDELDIFLDLFLDSLRALDNGEDSVQFPDKITIPKIFEVIFSQLSIRETSVNIYLELSNLLEKGNAIDEDFRRFLVARGQTVTHYRAAQPRLPLGTIDARSSSDDQVAQTLIIAIKALQETISDLRIKIDEELGGDSDVGHIRSGD